jgi:hypothetical protein
VTTPGALPQSVLDLIEFSPVEDLLLEVLRAGLPDVPVYSLIPKDAPDLFVLVRRMAGMGGWSGDQRFTDAGRFFINTFTVDPDGDAKGAQLSEAIRVVLRDAWLSNYTSPDYGSIIRIEMSQEPARRTDWATSSGPVQFADLPTGFWRYETTYTIKIRKPR